MCREYCVDRIFRLPERGHRQGEIATPNAGRVTKHLITPALPIGVLTYNNLGVPRMAGRRGCDMVGVALNRVMIHMCTGMQVRGVLW